MESWKVARRYLTHIKKSDISFILFFIFAVVAQSVEQRTENPCVDSSILSDGISFIFYRFSIFQSNLSKIIVCQF